MKRKKSFKLRKETRFRAVLYQVSRRLRKNCGGGADYCGHQRPSLDYSRLSGEKRKDALKG